MLYFVCLNCDSVLGLWGPPVFSQIAYGFLWACDATSTSEPHFHALLLARLAGVGPKPSPSCSEWRTPSPCLTTPLAAPGRDRDKVVSFSSTDLQRCPFTSQAASAWILNTGVYINSEKHLIFCSCLLSQSWRKQESKTEPCLAYTQSDILRGAEGRRERGTQAILKKIISSKLSKLSILILGEFSFSLSN